MSLPVAHVVSHLESTHSGILAEAGRTDTPVMLAAAPRASLYRLDPRALTEAQIGISRTPLLMHDLNDRPFSL